MTVGETMKRTTTLLVSVAVLAALSGCGSAPEKKPAPRPSDAAITPCPARDGSSQLKREFAAAPQNCLDTNTEYSAVIETNFGTMKFTLESERAPLAVNSFVYLARYHYFDGLGFHRAVPNFVIQGGDPNGDGTGGPGYMFKDELPDEGEYRIGDLAMANSGPDTNGSQFFVITGSDGAMLPPLYTLFGHLIEGREVMEEIAKLAVNDGPPSQPVTIISITIVES